MIVDIDPSSGRGPIRTIVRPGGDRVVVVVHGRGGAGDAAPVDAVGAAYLRRGWTVVAPHLRFSDANPSAGAGRDFTMEAHVDDLRAILRWTRRETTGGAVALAGHSMGAYAAARLGSEGEVAHLLALSPVISGAALLAARRALGAPALEALREEAPRAFEEWSEHDARPALARLRCPLAVIVGAEDGLTPPADARAFFDAAPGGCFFAALPGRHHVPEGPDFQRALEAALDAVGA